MLVMATALPAVGTIDTDTEKKTAMFLPPGVDWMKTYGGEEFNWLFDIKTTVDGYIAGGVLEYQNRMCAWMLKIDKNGTEEWGTVNDLWFGLNPVNNEIAVQCVLPVEDGFLAGGYGFYNDTDHTVVGHLWKVNHTGETQWTRVFRNETEEWSVCPMDMKQVGDEIICTGWMWQVTTPPDINLNAALFKTDLHGNLNESWVHHYDAGGFDWTRSLWICDDGYFLVGATEEPNPLIDNGAGYIVKTNMNGTKEWDKIFDGLQWDTLGVHGCRQTSNGGYIMAGNSGSWGDTKQDLWIVKTDAFGNVTWNKTYGGEYDDYCLALDAVDGGYVFVVIKDAWKTTEPKENLLIVQTNEEGDKIWEFELFENGVQWMQAIQQIDDHGFIVAGRTGHLSSSDCSGLIMEIAPLPKITIDVFGGLGVKATITNDGYGNAEDAKWGITVQGGFLGMVKKTAVGTITVPAGDVQRVSSGVFFGFGPVAITVTVGVVENTRSGFIIGPLVIVFKE